MKLNLSNAFVLDKDASIKLDKDRFLQVLVDSKLFFHHAGVLFAKIDDEFVPINKVNGNRIIRELFTESENLLIPSSTLSKARITLAELPELFSADINPNWLICFKNGYYNISTGSFQTDSQTSVPFTVKLRVSFIENLQLNEAAPNFHRYLCETFEEDDESIELLRQCLGYLLSNISSYRGALFWIGVPGAGKSLLAKLIRKIVPHTSAVGLHELRDRFRLSMLKNASVNICEEIGVGKINGFDVFKKITSGDTVILEAKNSQPEEAIIKTKFLFCGNFLPEINDYEPQAILERIVLLYFSHSTPKDKRDPSLFNLLVLEIDAIASWAVQALPDLIKGNMKFITPKKSIDYFERYSLEVASISNFISDRIILADTPTSKVHTRDLIDSYAAYCKANAIVPQSDVELKNAMAALPGVTYGKFRINGSNPKFGYKGIILRPPETEEVSE